MGVMRTILLKGAENRWMRERASRYRFVRRALRRFMPGERLENAIEAARILREQGLSTIFTRLGENLTDRSQAHLVVEHYIDVLHRITALNLPTVISVKLTQLGLDFDREFCFENLCRIIETAPPEDIVWVDIESSPYVDATLDIYRRARALHANVGVCLQAYLYRTAKDLESLLPLGPGIRLVKGAYKEPPEIAFPRKRDVDENYFQLASTMLGDEAQKHAWLPRLASGEILGAWGLTEPEAGSDSGATRTVAVRQGDGWVLRGSKNFITHAGVGGVAVVMARTAPFTELILPFRSWM